MKIKDIRSLQQEIGYAPLQRLVDTGQAWQMEGSTGRLCMSLLKVGALFLPRKDFRDYYGNIVPSRTKLKAGTTGTLELSIEYYTNKLYATDESI